MNTITHGKINLEQTLTTLKRRNMEGVANLLQCLIDNKHHAMQHEVTVHIRDGVEYVEWREEKGVDGASQPADTIWERSEKVVDAYFGIKA